MGGYGSTRWMFHNKAHTVEQSLQLDIYQLLRAGLLSRDILQQEDGQQSAFVSWKRGERSLAQMTFTLHSEKHRKALHLRYSSLGVPVHSEIPLEAIVPTFGGLKWYVRCPECGRRATKLLLPPGSRHFACRRCHSLTYQSSQESHIHDRLLGPEFDKLFRRLLKVTGKRP